MATFIAIVAFMLSLLLPQTVRIPGPGGHGVSAGGNTFTLGGGTTNFTCSSSPCTITTTVTSGRLIEIWFEANNNAVYITNITGAGTFTIPVGCRTTVSASHSLSCAYILSNTGASSLSLSYGASTGYGTLLEWSVSPGPPALDDLQVVQNTASSTQTMITPVITGTNDLLFQGIIAGSATNISSFTGAYTTGAQGSHSYGSVYFPNTVSTTAPVANLSASTANSVGELAFK